MISSLLFCYVRTSSSKRMSGSWLKVKVQTINNHSPKHPRSLFNSLQSPSLSFYFEKLFIFTSDLCLINPVDVTSWASWPSPFISDFALVKDRTDIQPTATLHTKHFIFTQNKSQEPFRETCFRTVHLIELLNCDLEPFYLILWCRSLICNRFDEFKETGKIDS